MNTPFRTRQWRQRTTKVVASLALLGGLTLTGCAQASTTSDSTSASNTSTTAAAQSSAAATSSGSTTTAETISSTTEASEAFLSTLSDEQREAVLYDYDDDTKSTSWSNFPVTFVDRAGLNLSDLTEEQQQAALAVLQELMSEESYATVEGIMGGDQYLNDNSSTTEDSLGQYYIAFFGDPSDTEAWSLQFGGHHLGINADLNGTEDTITFAPTHLGVQPAVYTNEDGEEVQPFDGIYTDAFAFYNSLSADQQETLTSGEVTMCAPGDTCDFETGSGLSGSDLTDEQKDLLLELIANWAGMSDEQTNETAMAEIEATLDDTVIAWSGETTYDMSTGDGISFSISGPNVYVAFQAQSGSAGADVEGVSTSGWGHVHTIYRDPTNDYAGSVTQEAATGMGAGAPAGA
ncbi:DUF3500 domain-containing protein [Kocuria sp.]|uniref:DUF3500 domain-containing protein n=1 Tax=Kocuria sp. TaxID=1871328 RepID=UPI0026DEE48C|nr:DUF3500 domain-containing protein [Kocuria sp.]MDO5618137.1 DUF3500 domain-containing protein [Kocuria sp.]